MERRQLEYFVAVVEHRSVTRAAKHLHVSQPTISAALHRLERELGGLLFERVGSRFVLTAAGQAMIAPAQAVLQDLSVAAESVRDVLGLGGGVLEICAVPAVAAGWLPDVLMCFRAEYPAVGIRVHSETDSAVIAEGVRSGRFNAGLSVSEPGDPMLISQKVGHQEMRVLLPPGSQRSDEPVPVEDLAALDLITWHGGASTSRRWLEQELRKRGLEPTVAIEVGSVEGIPPLVDAGAGYALWWSPMPVSLIGSGVLRPLRPAFRRNIHVVVRPGPQAPATAAFLKTVTSAHAHHNDRCGPSSERGLS